MHQKSSEQRGWPRQRVDNARRHREYVNKVVQGKGKPGIFGRDEYYRILREALRRTQNINHFPTTTTK